MLERWCCFFKHAPQISVADLKKLVDHPILEEAYQALDQHYWSETEYLAYEHESKRIQDHKAMLDEAEYKGEQKGREQGRQEGRQERTLEIAKKLLATDMPMGQVKQVTQLSDEDIAKLQGN